MTDALSTRTSTGNALSPASRLGPVLTVLLTATFVVQFDFFVVNVAAPSVEHDLGAGSAALELIVGGYAFAYAGGMVTGGRLGDMLGHRRMFVIGACAFAVASLLCGIAANPGELVAARLVQGLAGAAMAPQVLAVITADFPNEMKPKAMAGYGVAAGLGSIAGQILGGALVQADVAGLGWRLIFLINVPICAVIALLAPRVLPAPKNQHRTRLDPVGVLGLCAALALLLVPLTLGHSEGWPVWTWICMACSLPLFALTLRWEQALGKRGGSPVLVLSLFRSHSFRTGMIASAAFMLYFGSFMFTLTLLLQSGLDLNPFKAGLVFSPMGILFTATSMVGRRLIARYGMKALVWSSLVAVLGLLLLALRLFFAQADVGIVWIVVFLCLIGGGNGVILPALYGATLMQVRPKDAGTASGILTTTQQFASSSGVAVIGAVFFAVAGSKASSDDYGTAMAWSTSISVVLVLAVTWMTWTFQRIAAPAKRAEPSDG
jgi:MFS family permease